jgi:hypothetical protein
MRLVCGIAIALSLGLTAAGMPASQQQPGLPTPADQATTSPEAPVQNPSTQNPTPKDASAQSASPEYPDAEKSPSSQAPAETTPASSTNPEPPAAVKKQPRAAKKKTHTASTSKAKKRRSHPAATPTGAPRKIVVREGGASEPAAQIVPGMSSADATRERTNAERLLSSTQDQLNLLSGRGLDVQQVDTVGQIHNYMNAARSALKEGDVGRANTMAQKAHLLAEDLVKH